MKLALTLIGSVAVLGITGCASFHTMTAEKGKPLDSQAVSQIQIGSTTRSDIFRLMGTPHSMFEGQAEFEEAQQVGYYSHEENRTLSSLGPDQYAMLYRFGKTSAKGLAASAVIVTYSRETIRLNADELLILVDRDTNVVRDVAYRQETD